MKKILLSIGLFLAFNSGFSQDTERAIESKPNYDSLWYFHPFSIDLAAGVWVPIGKLSNYFTQSYQFGVSFGLMTGPKSRLQFWMVPRLMNSRRELPIVVSAMSTISKGDNLGASIGASFLKRVCQNKWMCNEIHGGLSWEFIPVVIKIPNNENDSLHISGIGFSIGFNTWFNAFSRLNFGLRGAYTYATFNNSSYTTQSIGNHLVSISLIYRFPRRNMDWKRWY